VPKAISGTSTHDSSMPMVALDWQGMTSRWCSTATLSQGRITVVL